MKSRQGNQYKSTKEWFENIDTIYTEWSIDKDPSLNKDEKASSRFCSSSLLKIIASLFSNPWLRGAALALLGGFIAFMASIAIPAGVATGAAVGIVVQAGISKYKVNRHSRFFENNKKKDPYLSTFVESPSSLSSNSSLSTYRSSPSGSSQ